MSDANKTTDRTASDEMLAKVEAVRAEHQARVGLGRMTGKVGVVTGVASEKGMG